MILVDAHVHIYDCFDLKKFFDSAYENFKSEADKQGHMDNFIGILLLAETTKDNWFHNLSEYANGKSLPGNRNTGTWKLHHSDETCSLHVRSGYNRGLVLIAGRQLITAEGLELLALGASGSFEEGIPIKELIKTVRENGSIPVIPWGVGKWMGKRGNILDSLLESINGFGLFLGDNSGRPIFLRRPRLFKKGEAQGIRVFPGSDPLPLVNEYHRVGKFGFRTSGNLSSENPAKDLKQILVNSAADIQPYGRLERPFRFFYNQLSLRFRPLISGS